MTLMQRFTSRKFLVALVAAVGGLAIPLWPEHEDQIKSLMTQAVDIVGLLIAVISAVAYIVTEGKVDAARASNTAPTDTVVKGLGFILILGLMLPMSGCASYTPQQKWATARTSLTTAQNIMTQLAATHALTDKQIVEADAGIQSARAALTAAEAMLPEGADGFDDYLKIADVVLDRLLQMQLEAAGRTSASPSGP